MSDNDSRFKWARQALRTLLDREEQDAEIEVVASDHSRSLSQSRRFCFESVRPAYDGGRSVELGEDDSTQTDYSGKAGLVIDVVGYTPGIEATLSEETDAEKVYLTDADRETIASMPAPDGGESVTFDVPLEDGEYRVLADGDGSAYTRGRGRVDMPIGPGDDPGDGDRDESDEESEDDSDDGDRDDEPKELDQLELPDDGEGQTGHSNLCGVAIVPDQDLDGLEVRLGGERYREAGAEDITALHVFDDQQDRLATHRTPGSSAGDLIGIDYEFSEGREYRILADAEGERYVRYRAEASMPYEGDGLTVIAGSYSPGDNSQTENYVYNFDRIRGVVGKSVAEPEPEYRDLALETISGASMAALDSNPAGGERQVLRVDYEDGGFDGINERHYMSDVIGYEPDIAHARYQMFVPSDFQWRENGRNGGTKISGFATPNGCGAGGSLCTGEGFSARGMCPRPGGYHGLKCEGDVPLGFQVYDSTSTDAGEEYGWHHMFDYGGDKGRWFTVDIRVEAGTPGEADSRIVAWVNGKKAFDYDEYLFFDEDHADEAIEQFRWHYYYGGSWGSPKAQSLYLRRAAFWGDDNCPELDGI